MNKCNSRTGYTTDSMNCLTLLINCEQSELTVQYTPCNPLLVAMELADMEMADLLLAWPAPEPLAAAAAARALSWACLFFISTRGGVSTRRC